MRRLFQVTAAMAFVAIAAVSSAARANAFGTNLIISSTPGGGQFCMDAAGNRKEDGTPVFLYRCRGAENQRWTVTQNVDGTSVITGTGGLCLDVRRGSVQDGTPVELYHCHFGGNQRFRVFDDGRIQEAASGKCLMVAPDGGEQHQNDPRWVFDRLRERDYEHVRFSEHDGAPIILFDCESRALQFWRLSR